MTLEHVGAFVVGLLLGGLVWPRVLPRGRRTRNPVLTKRLLQCADAALDCIGDGDIPPGDPRTVVPLEEIEMVDPTMYERTAKPLVGSCVHCHYVTGHHSHCVKRSEVEVCDQCGAQEDRSHRVYGCTTGGARSADGLNGHGINVCPHCHCVDGHRQWCAKRRPRVRSH